MTDTNLTATVPTEQDSTVSEMKVDNANSSFGFKTIDCPAMPKTPFICNNFINGNETAPKNGLYMDVLSPHTNEIIGKVALSTKVDVQCAMLAAQVAYSKWRKWTVKERMKPLLRLRMIIEQREEELVDIIMLEHGKNRSEALGSIRKANETVQYACAMPSLIAGRILQVSNGVTCSEFREPLGIVSSIVPFNFPVMVPMWTMPIAIACGNCFILKPSEKVPITMSVFAKYMAEAGFPNGVFQIIHGQADAVNALIDHPQIKAVSFVGSSKIARIVYDRCKSQSPPKRCLCLGGAKNHLVAVSDCNISMTAKDVVSSFCGCAGERCMAASVLLLVGKQEKLLQMIIDIANGIQPGMERGQMGPIIDKLSLNKIVSYLEMAGNDNQEILLDGRTWIEKYGRSTNGNWIGPSVILLNDSSHRIMSDEIFGPVLAVYICSDAEEAIAIENANPYGNAACIYTSTGENADFFQKRFSAGMIGVNVGVPVPREPFAFGGINASKFGDCDITADGGIEFWTWRKKVTTKWTPPEVKTWMN